MSIKILVAPFGFKESLGAEEVANCIEKGVLHAMPTARVIKAPLVDGGEGFTKALVKATGGTLRTLKVTGPVGKPVESHYGVLGNTSNKTAVIEMAAAAGLQLVPHDKRNPLETTTSGVGELIKAALDEGAERILMGCGDAGANDGGAGMAQALGARFLDDSGKALGQGGGNLQRLAQIDLSGLDPRLKQVKIDVACNWQHVLCGAKGVAWVFGPQKGASLEQLSHVEKALDRYAAVIKRDLEIDVCTMPGGGASGGLGAGLHALLGATLHPRYEIVMQYLELDQLLDQVDLVMTTEGAMDSQTLYSKFTTRPKPFNLPIVAVVGMIGKGATDNEGFGIDSSSSRLEASYSLDDAIRHTPEYLTRAAEWTLRSVVVGRQVAPPVMKPHADPLRQAKTIEANWRHMAAVLQT